MFLALRVIELEGRKSGTSTTLSERSKGGNMSIMGGGGGGMKSREKRSKTKKLHLKKFC